MVYVHIWPYMTLSTFDPMNEDRWFGCYEAQRGDLFTRESNRHPAKMAVGLCLRIFEHGREMGYWKPGDLILDPMAGIFTTGIVGAVLGYRCMGVELELHFLELARKNIDFASGKFHPLGACAIAQGDARSLRELLADGALSSPPYPSEFREQHPGTEGGQVALELERGGSFRGYSGVVASPPYADRGLPSMVRSEIRQLGKAGKWDEAIILMREVDREDCEKGNRRSPHSDDYLRQAIEYAIEREEGQYGARAPQAVVTSPPYGDLAVMQGAGVTHRILKIAREQGMPAAVAAYRMDVIDTQKAHGRWSDENIRRHIEMALASAETGGYQAVVSSPPYSENTSHSVSTGQPPVWDGGKDSLTRLKRDYSRSESIAQIGNLRDPAGDIDAVLSSPPWENQTASAKASDEYRKAFDLKKDPRYACRHRGNMWNTEYGASEGQIGNEKGETYLSAMLQVYQQLSIVLKVGGVVCLVTKNPVKKGQIRRLDLDTIRLMEACGFALIERYNAMLAEEIEQGHLFGGPTTKRRERKSFFKRLFEKLHPDLRVDHEDVLFFRKAA